MSNIIETITTVLIEILDGEKIKIDANTDFEEDLDLDSILFVQFLLALEQNIEGLVFHPDQINQSSFNNVGTLAQYISENAATESI